MKRMLLLGVVGMMVVLFVPRDAWAFGWKDVLKMHEDGIADSLIIQKIDHSGKTFRLEARDLHRLKEAGVSDGVISAMLRTEDRYDERVYYDDDYYGGYTHPRVYVGLGFGYYGGYWPYYGGYWPRYYGSRYYGGRYYGGHYYTPRSYSRYPSPSYGTARTRTEVNGGGKSRPSGSRARSR
ncbi:MAG TPA: hypothetical protein VF363_07690 [Candidatus Eisenbacteria bacterium]